MVVESKKTIQLPQEVGVYLDSMKALELNLYICKNNGLSGDDIGKHTDLITALFLKELALEDLVAKIKQIFKFDDFKAKKLAADIAGIRLLVVDDIWFKGEIASYLNSLSVPPANYKKIVDEQKIAVRKEKEEDAIEEAERQAEKMEKEAALHESEEAPIKKEEPLEIEGDFKINWEEEKEEILKTFKNGLADIISVNAAQEELNDVLIYLLTKEGESFRSELERILLANNEVLTFTKFIVDGRPAPAVISAWLKNFISEVGSIKFDNLALTKFLTNSANAKILGEEEKMIVKRLLLLYRNLKFFPESMPNETGVGWAIIPFDVSDDMSKVKTVSTPLTDDFIDESKSLAAIKTAEQEEKERAKAAELEKEIAHMKELLVNYPEKSLERKAIEGEIKKLEVRSKK